MIFDKIENIAQYSGISEEFAIAAKFLSDGASAKLAAGRYDLEGGVYCMVQEPELKAFEDTKYECHRLYADIQYVVEGEERIDYANIGDTAPWGEYTVDIAFAEAGESSTPLILKPGWFAVFFPQDAHRPCIVSGGSHSSKKLVVKVPCGGK